MSTWTTPMTWPTSPYVVTGPDLNRELRDNLIAIHPALILTSTNLSLSASDGHSIAVAMSAASAPRTVTPYGSSAHVGALVRVEKTDSSSNAVTIVATINGTANRILTTQFECITLLANGIDWSIVAWYRPFTRTNQGVNYSAALGDDVIEASNTITITLHAVASDRAMRPIVVKNAGTGVVTVAGAGTDVIDTETSIELNTYDSVTLIQNRALTAWLII